MQDKLYLIALLLVLSLASTAPGVSAAETEPGSEHLLSANIPLDSYIYAYLDKLAGLGLLDGMPTGTKPYTRIQVARWVRGIERRVADGTVLPDFAETMVRRLEMDLAVELGLLGGEERKSRLAVDSLSWSASGYDGWSLEQNRTLSWYQPLNINNNGHELADGFNAELELGIEGNLGNAFLLSLDSWSSYHEDDDWTTRLTSGYLKTHLGNLEIQVGKDELWWGQGLRGSLALTNNAPARTGIKLSTIDPIQFDGFLKFLGPVNASFFYEELAEDRTDVRGPGFMGIRTDFSPTPNFTLACALTSIVGGEGHELSWGDLWDLITGENAITATEDKWNAIAGWDFRWRIPALNGLEIYGEYYGEDQAFELIPLPTKNAPVLGIYLPRLTSNGDWDLTFETARTSYVWYGHSLYTDGYTDQGHIIGDAMGNHAQRYYVGLNHYLSNGSRMAFHGEYVLMDADAQYPQKVTSFWTTYQTFLANDWTLDFSAGLSFIENSDFQEGAKERFTKVSVGMGKRF